MLHGSFVQVVLSTVLMILRNSSSIIVLIFYKILYFLVGVL